MGNLSRRGSLHSPRNATTPLVDPGVGNTCYLNETCCSIFAETTSIPASLTTSREFMHLVAGCSCNPCARRSTNPGSQKNFASIRQCCKVKRVSVKPWLPWRTTRCLHSLCQYAAIHGLHVQCRVWFSHLKSKDRRHSHQPAFALCRQPAQSMIPNLNCASTPFTRRRLAQLCRSALTLVMSIAPDAP